MAPPEEEDVIEPVWQVDEDFLKQLEPVITQYLNMVHAFADDDGNSARTHSENAINALDAVDTEALDEEESNAWYVASERLEDRLRRVRAADNIEDARAALEQVTTSLETVLDLFGLPPGITLYRIHCPMAFEGRGADWLFDEEEVLNPYFGAAMLRCGEVLQTLE